MAEIEQILLEKRNIENQINLLVMDFTTKYNLTFKGLEVTERMLNEGKKTVAVKIRMEIEL